MQDKTRNFLPVPTKCDKCSSSHIEFKNEAEIYDTQRRDWPWVWHCNNCNAMVGCHFNTNRPLGYMANWTVRQKRSKLHSLIDPLWKYNIYPRYDLYDSLAEILGIADKECHISTMTLDQLNISIEHMQAIYKQNEKAIRKVERKQRADYKLKTDRAARRIRRRKKNIRPID